MWSRFSISLTVTHQDLKRCARPPATAFPQSPPLPRQAWPAVPRVPLVNPYFRAFELAASFVKCPSYGLNVCLSNSCVRFQGPVHVRMLSRFSHVRLSQTLWAAALQARLPEGFSRQEEWASMPSSRGPSQPGIEPASLMSPALASGFFTTSHLGSLLPPTVPQNVTGDRIFKDVTKLK